MNLDLIPFLLLAILLTYLPSCERRGPESLASSDNQVSLETEFSYQPAARIPANLPDYAPYDLMEPEISVDQPAIEELPGPAIEVLAETPAFAPSQWLKTPKMERSLENRKAGSMWKKIWRE